MDVSPPPDKPLPPMPASHNKKENKLFTYIFKKPGESLHLVIILGQLDGRYEDFGDFYRLYKTAF